MKHSYRPNQIPRRRATKDGQAALQTQTIQPSVLQQALEHPQATRPETMLQLQRLYGNRAVGQLIARQRAEAANTPSSAQPVLGLPPVQQTGRIERVIDMKFMANVGLVAGQTNTRNATYKKIRDMFDQYQKVSKKANKIESNVNKIVDYQKLIKEEYELLKKMKSYSKIWINVHTKLVPVEEQRPNAKKTQDLTVLLNQIEREIKDPKFDGAKSDKYLEKISEYKKSVKSSYIETSSQSLTLNNYELALNIQEKKNIGGMRHMLGEADMDEETLVKKFDDHVAALKPRVEALYKLSPAERAAIRTYTNQQFSLMNPLMAGNEEWFASNLKEHGFEGELANPERAKKSNKKINKMTQLGMSKLPNWQQDRPLYRGETFSTEEARNIASERKKTYHHFVSTSLGTKIPESYARSKRSKERSVGIVWHITQSKNGKNIIDLSVNSGEQEILFPANTTFYVDDIISQKKDSGGIIKELKVHEG